MMTRRKRTIIVLLILLVLILLLVWFFIVLFSKADQSVVTPESAYDEEEVIVVEEDVVKAPLSKAVEEAEKEKRSSSANVVSLSKTFTERYGSYSNEAKFANLSDVLPLMSSTFAANTQEFIDGATAPEEYYGVSTRLITVSVDEYDEGRGRASASITTQREIAEGSPQDIRIEFQDIALTFITEDGVWKVDSATWQ